MSAQQMMDITGADQVEVKIRRDSKVLWVNVGASCVLRICQIKELSVEQGERMAAEGERDSKS